MRVGVNAPDKVAGKVCYALDQLLTAGEVRHRIERAETAANQDLFYGLKPPEGSVLWMAASEAAWRYFERPGQWIEQVETTQVGECQVRLPGWVLGAGDRVPTPDAPRPTSLPDLALAAFYFLSRWEEWQAPERDRFGRFPLAASVFGRGLWSLTECPVERYAHALVGALCPEGVGCRGKGVVDRHLHRSPYTLRPGFTIGLSHDIDSLQRWDGRGFARTGRSMVWALGRARFRAAVRDGLELVGGLRVRVGGGDPHMNLEQILALEQDLGVRSTFFLLPRHSHRWDGTHPSWYQRQLPAMARLLADVAEIGVHASTACSGDPALNRDAQDGQDGRRDLFPSSNPGHPGPVTGELVGVPERRNVLSLREERERLEGLIEAPVRGVRFHNLRCRCDLMKDVAAAGYEYDSTLGFAEGPGFRAGIARPFQLYDCERDCPLDLIEVPLAVMDTTLLSPRYLGLDALKGREQALAALEAVRDCGGAAALLWHNDNLPPNEAGGFARLYAELIEWVRAEGGRMCPLSELVDEWKNARNA
jgi:hypothetical protein